MFKTVCIIGGLVLLSACQTTGEITEVSYSESPKTMIMKDVKPKSGAAHREWGFWNDDMPESAWSFNVTNKVQARSGELSQRFELRNGDCTVHSRNASWGHDPNWGCLNDRERAEVSGKQWRPGTDQWVGFSVMVNDENKIMPRNHCTSIFQIKQYEDNVYQGNLNPENGDYSDGHYIGGHSVIMGEMCGNNFGVKLFWAGYENSKYNGWSRDETITYGKVGAISGDWNDIVLRYDTRDYRNKNSVLEIYMNGELVGSWKNITSNFFPDLYTFKYGLYRSWMKANNGENYKSVKQVIYFDEFRYGRSYEAVSPEGKKAID